MARGAILSGSSAEKAQVYVPSAAAKGKSKKPVGLETPAVANQMHLGSHTSRA